MNNGDPTPLSGSDLRRRYERERHNATRRHIAGRAPDMTHVTGFRWCGSPPKPVDRADVRRVVRIGNVGEHTFMPTVWALAASDVPSAIHDTRNQP